MKNIILFLSISALVACSNNARSPVISVKNAPTTELIELSVEKDNINNAVAVNKGSWLKASTKSGVCEHWVPWLTDDRMYSWSGGCKDGKVHGKNELMTYEIVDDFGEKTIGEYVERLSYLNGKKHGVVLQFSTNPPYLVSMNEYDKGFKDGVGYSQNRTGDFFIKFYYEKNKTIFREEYEKNKREVTVTSFKYDASGKLSDYSSFDKKYVSSEVDEISELLRYDSSSSQPWENGRKKPLPSSEACRKFPALCVE